MDFKLVSIVALSLGAAAAATAARAADCPALDRDAATALTLAQVQQRVRRCHPDVIGADAAIAAASADVITAGQGPNPQLTLGAGSISRNGYGSGSLWQKTFDHQIHIDQLIERGDKASLRRASAEATVEAVRADRAEVLRQALLTTQRSLIDLAAALARRTETEATLSLNDESSRMIERRVRAGDAAALDATRLMLDALRVRADFEQSKADVQALRLQLALAIGARPLAEVLTPSTTVVADAQLAASPSTQPDQTERRPDVAAARARLSAADAALALAQSQRTRDVSVGVGFDHYPVNAVNTSGSGNTVSLSLSIPLNLRHNHEGEVARADADVATARDTLRKVTAASDADLARARSQWRAASARRALAVDQMAPAAERVAAGAELAYQRGASPVLDVLDARRSLRAARIERINAEADLARAVAELDAARQPIESFLP